MRIDRTFFAGNELNLPDCLGHDLPAVRLPSQQNFNLLKDLAKALREGDRVIAPSRPGFPAGTIMKCMSYGYFLVKWDGNVLETTHLSELSRGN